ncbi:MAG TPA: FAD-dependent oxidoreductase [Armatimonadota bacterium]|mgnify:CR=1 FL=1|nr:FAD-dependent oxidoreductase [Armatimonadota bacterium]HOS42522.1 FAD-dependent oxidoreductase [Armatimonadota bacterium]
MATYHEPARDVPILDAVDVLVCGGGPAGCAAAVAAARHGANTLLVEQDGALGGAPVTQHVLAILSTNGADFQGLWHEWARALRRLGGLSPLTWEPRFGTRWLSGSIDPVYVPYAWDELLTAAGARVLHLARVASAIVEDGAVRGAFIETKAGRRAVLARRVVDATGDGDLCAAAGVPWEQGTASSPCAMAAALVALYGGVRTAPDYLPGTINSVGGTGRSAGQGPLFMAGLNRVLNVDPVDPWALTRALREGRAMVLARYRERTAQPDADALFLAALPHYPGVRSSRRVRGLATVTAEDAMTFTKYPDGIARASWEVDIHPADSPTGKAVSFDDPAYQPRMRRAEAGDYYDIRYGALVAAGVDNLLVAGRCLSAEHMAQASLRIQQTCLGTGQAAGAAAALSLRANVPPRLLDTARLVAQLAADRDVEPADAVFANLPAVG